MNYVFHLLVYVAIYSIVAMSLNVVVGYCGLITLVHAGFFAIGGYAYALATLHWGIGFVPATLFGVALAAVLSLVVSVPAWRLKGDFFVLVSLAAQALIFSVLYNWWAPGATAGTWENLTNGPLGIAGISQPQIGSIHLESITSIALLSVLLACLCGFILWLLLASPYGRLLKALRDDELAARSLGKNVRLAKVQAFGIACGMVAAAGALYAAYVRYLHPQTASLDQGILMLCMVLIGGTGNLRGPLVGAIVLLAIPEALRFIHIPDVMAANVRLLLFGLLLVVFMHKRPEGLAGTYRLE
jgi:branched-chain amino acid transport system permease protein